MDDKKKKGYQDDSKISLTQAYEVAYWTKKFGVTEDQLRQAIIDAGSNGVQNVMANLIEKELYKIPDDEIDSEFPADEMGA